MVTAAVMAAEARAVEVPEEARVEAAMAVVATVAAATVAAATEVVTAEAPASRMRAVQIAIAGKFVRLRGVWLAPLRCSRGASAGGVGSRRDAWRAACGWPAPKH